MAAHRAPRNVRFSKYIPSKENVFRVTAVAAFLTSAIFGGVKLGEGFAQVKHADGYSLDAGNGQPDFADKLVNDSIDTFVDLSLGVGSTTLAGLLAAGGIMQYRRRNDEEPTYQNGLRYDGGPDLDVPEVPQAHYEPEPSYDEVPAAPAPVYAPFKAPALPMAAIQGDRHLANEDREAEFAVPAPSSQFVPLLP